MREVARVEALLEQRQPDGGAEVGVGDGQQALGRRLQRQGPSGCATCASIAGPRRGHVEPHAAAEEAFAVEPAEREVGVGHGRLACRRGRSRRDPGASRRSRGPTVSRPPARTVAIEPPPAPMVRISTIGRRTGIRSISPCGDEVDPPVPHDGDVEAGAAHVDADEVGLAQRLR